MAESELTDAVRAPDDYQSWWAAAARRGYSGVGTYSRRPIRGWRVGLGIERFDVEGRVLMTDLGDFDLYNVYFPNGKQGAERLAYKHDFYAAFLEQVIARAAAGRPVVFCGDVNTAHRAIDLARPRENARTSGFLLEERTWLDRWTAAGWVDAFRYLYPERSGAYSWWDQRTGARARNAGWRLDYFFVHQSLLSRVRDSGIASDVIGSDHCPVWLDLAD